MISPIHNVNLYYHQLESLSLEGIARMQHVFGSTSMNDYFLVAGQKAYEQQGYIQFMQQVTTSTEALHHYAKSLYDSTQAFDIGGAYKPWSPLTPEIPEDPVEDPSPPRPDPPSTSDRSIMTVDGIEGGDVGSFDVKVIGLQNERFITHSDTLNANDKWGDIDVGATGYGVQYLVDSTYKSISATFSNEVIGIKSTDTVKVALTKFATYINYLHDINNVELTMSVEEVSPGQVRLVVEENKGSTQHITVQQTGSELLGLNTITQTLEDRDLTEYEIDGTTYTVNGRSAEIDGYGTIYFHNHTQQDDASYNTVSVHFTGAASVTSNVTSTHDTISGLAAKNGLEGEFQIQVEQKEVEYTVTESVSFGKWEQWGDIMGGFNALLRVPGGALVTTPFSIMGISSDDTAQEALMKFATYANGYYAKQGLHNSYEVKEDASGDIYLVHRQDPTQEENYEVLLQPSFYSSTSTTETKIHTTYDIDGAGPLTLITDPSEDATITLEGYGTLYLHGPTQNALGESEFATVTFTAPKPPTNPGSGSGSISVGTPVRAIEDFLYQYNNMISFMNQNQEYIRSQSARFLTSAPRYHAHELRQMGITIQSDGTLWVEDRKRLEYALTHNQAMVDKVFLGAYRGVATEARTLSEKIITSPFGAFTTENLRFDQSVVGNAEKHLISSSLKYMMQEKLVDSLKEYTSGSRDQK